MKAEQIMRLIKGVEDSTIILPVVYVNSSATGNNDGTSWTDAYTSILSAVSCGYDCQIWLAAGNYTLTYGMSNYKRFVIYGGFAGTETTKYERVAGNITYLNEGASTINLKNTNNVFDRIAFKSTLYVVGTFINCYFFNSGFTPISNCSGTWIGCSVYASGTIARAFSDSSGSIINCSIWAKGSTGNGIALFYFSGTVVNTAMWSTMKNVGGGEITQFDNNCYYPASDDDPTIGSNNIVADPLFLRSALIITILSGSPCIGAGNNSFLADYNLDYDIACNPRINNSIVDIGCHEYQ